MQLLKLLPFSLKKMFAVADVARPQQQTFHALLAICHIKRVCLICLLCISLGLTGCQPVAKTDPNIVHLTLWQGVNPPPNRDVLNRLVDRFNQTHSTVQVESLYVGQGDQQIPKILAATVGNAAPNLLWYAPTLTGQLVELDALKPLDQWFEQLPIRTQVDPVLRETMAYDNHLWSIPFSVNNVGIFYRPSLFQAAGITEVPKTWDALRQTAKQLTRDGQNGRQHGLLLPLGKAEWTVFTWLPFMWSGGGELTSPDTSNLDALNPDASNQTPSKVQLDNPGAIAALKLWQDLIKDGSAILSQPERGYELDGFIAGKVAMQITGPWTLAQLQSSGADYAVMPIPTGVRPATNAGGENLFIFKGSPAEEAAALTFAEYVLSEEFQTEWAIGTGYLPVNLKSRQSDRYRAFVQTEPAVEVFLQQAQYGRSRPIFPGYNRLSDAIGRAVEATLLQKTTPEEAVAIAQKRLDLSLPE
jgi:multiple sugar transport system substrate-binding protein